MKVTSRSTLGRNTSALSLAVLLLFALGTSISAEAQSFNVIFGFTGGLDGGVPLSGLSIDRAGNIYGANFQGGNHGGNCGTGGCGSVYKLSYRGTGWILTPLYDFSGNDGSTPVARVTIGPDGSLYGTTIYGGGTSCQNHGFAGCGVVFRLQPPVNICVAALCPWRETVIYRFNGGADGALPSSEISFDQSGNLYGTTVQGGTGACSGGCGVIYKLSRSNGGWVQSVVHDFAGGSDGRLGGARATLDQSGNLYTTTVYGGANDVGAVIELSPSGSGWSERVIYSFTAGSDGYWPYSSVIFDAAGNLYGTTSSGGQNGGGTVFQLMREGGNWTFGLLYSFYGYEYGGPGADLTFQGGKLYGTTAYDAPGDGNIFELTPSGGGWTYTSLYDFQYSLGGSYTNVAFDPAGNGYGTTQGGISDSCPPSTGCGFVWQIAP